MGHLSETDMVLSSPSRVRLMANYMLDPDRDRKAAAGEQI